MQDDKSLEVIYRKYYLLIYNFFFYQLLHRENAEDLTSQTFLKVAEKLDTYDREKGNISTWLWKIAQNTLIDFYRRKKYEISLNKDISGIWDAISVSFEEQYEQIAAPKRKELYQALTKLTNRERILIYQKYYLGKSYREISREFHLKESTLATIMQRAKVKLRHLAVIQ